MWPFKKKINIYCVLGGIHINRETTSYWEDIFFDFEGTRYYLTLISYTDLNREIESSNEYDRIYLEMIVKRNIINPKLGTSNFWIITDDPTSHDSYTIYTSDYIINQEIAEKMIVYFMPSLEKYKFIWKDSVESIGAVVTQFKKLLKKKDY